jgi:phosphoenolpyruvate carboxykinase (ATP)
MAEFNLVAHGITVEDVQRNLAPAKLYAEAIREEPDCAIADSGALIAYSGAKTGRSPKDKRVVNAVSRGVRCHTGAPRPSTERQEVGG